MLSQNGFVPTSSSMILIFLTQNGNAACVALNCLRSSNPSHSIQAMGSRLVTRHQAPSHVTARISGETLWEEWSLKEDCFRQGPRDPEHYYSPEGGGDNKNRRTNQNAETHNQEAEEPRGKNKARPSVWGQTMVPSLLVENRLKAGKLCRWRLLFVDCSPSFILSVSSALS